MKKKKALYIYGMLMMLTSVWLGSEGDVGPIITCGNSLVVEEPTMTLEEATKYWSIEEMEKRFEEDMDK